MSLNESDRHTLLQIARESIQYGVQYGKEREITIENFSEPLCEKRASFVTLKLHNGLRGCIGTLEAYQPLVLDVSRNSYAAAFLDPRFPPVQPNEVALLSLHISILTIPELIQFSSEADLLAQLRPGVDGLILSDKGYRGTFLPSVWEELPDPIIFLKHLKMKAGLPIDYWSDSLQVFRYMTEIVE